MKRKIACVLSTVLMTVMLGACGTDPTTVDYNGHTYSDLSSQTVMQAYFTAAFGDYKNQLLMSGQTEIPEEELEYYVGNGVSEYVFDSLDKWNEIQGEFGTDIQILEDTDGKNNPEKEEFVNLNDIDPTNFKPEQFTVTKSGETLTTDIILKVGKRNVDYQLVYDYFSMEITGVTIEPVYSLSEKMAKAGLNTVISLCIVFAVLILISLIICCFNIFPYIEKKKKEKAAKLEALNTTDTTPAEETVASDVTEAATDDAELIAVIAAAIAASEGTTTDGFVVRSINRR